MKSAQKVMVWVVCGKEKPKILLLKTLASRGAFWQPITGWVDEGETPVQAAVREAKEESGLIVQEKIQSLQYRFSFSSRHDGAIVNEEVYFCVLDDPLDRKMPSITMDTKEHQDFTWIELTQKEKIKSLLPQKEVQEAFERLWERLSKKI